MFIKTFTIFVIILNFYSIRSQTFLSAVGEKNYAMEEHKVCKGYALKGMDQLAILVDAQNNRLKERFQKSVGSPGFNGCNLDICNMANMIGKLVTAGIFDDGKTTRIDYGNGLVPKTKEHAQLITIGLLLFKRFSDNANDRFTDFKKLTSTVGSVHQDVLTNILELAQKTTLARDVEDAMWLPAANWGSPAGTYRKAIMQQTWAAIEHGYIAEDGIIVLPSLKSALHQALGGLANAVVKDLSADQTSEYFPNGIVGQPAKPCGQKTHYMVIQGDSVEVARALSKRASTGRKIAILNMANTHTPGGGAWHGTSAQEEQLCFRSNLLKTLECHRALGAYDPADKKFGISRKVSRSMDCDSGIFSPEITFFRDRINGETLPHYGFKSSFESYGVITSAARHLSHRKPSDYVSSTEAKIRFQLRSAAAKNYTDLVLGAFGCGAFKGDFKDLPYEVAYHYWRVLEEPEFVDRFHNVCFAVLVKSPGDSDNLKAFREIFDRAEESPLLAVKEAGKVSINFDARILTTLGQSVYVVGNTPELGKWDPKKALKLSSAAYPRWKGTFSLSIGAGIEYKYIKVQENGDVIWDDGVNLSFVPDADKTLFYLWH